MKIEQLRQERIVVLGMGVNNQALAAYLLRMGCQLTLRDSKPEVEEQFRRAYPELPSERMIWQIQEDILTDLEPFTLAIRTPVISANEPRLLAQPQLRVSSQTKLFFEWSPARIIGVTGTKGKGTTCTLIANILRAAKLRGEVYLAGNIGVDPFSFYEQLKPEDTVVMELSSFQLEDMTQSPEIAVLLRIGVDHLDRHSSLEEYRTAKLQLLAHQRADDIAIVHAANLPLPAMPKSQLLSYDLHEVESVLGREIIRIQLPERQFEIDTSNRQLLGMHNLENIIPAILVAGLLGVPENIIQQEVIGFPGLEHRLQFVTEVMGIRFYDDSIATTPEASMVAVEAFAGKRLHLIAGGNTKGGDYTAWRQLVATRCATLSLLPGSLRSAEQPLLAQTIQDLQSSCQVQTVDGVNPAASAILQLRSHLQPGDVVLLAPGGTSFASYRSYKERGEAFATAARALTSEDGQ